MDAPNPDSGEEYFHTNTQLYNTLDEHNRFKIGEAVTAPWNVPPPGTEPTMDGFVTDYISTFTGEVGRQPTYEEYAQIMTGYTPEQVPVLNGVAKGFGVFDHWFCEVPSQTFMNRSFWTAGTSSGFVTNSAGDEVDEGEHRRDAVRPAGGARTHLEGVRAGTVSPLVHGLDPHAPAQGPPGDAHRAVLGVRARRGQRDAAGLQPDRAAPGRRARRLPPGGGQILLGDDVDIAIDPPSSILSGEDFLARIYRAIRSADSSEGSNAYNTTFFIGWDEPGGTYDHVPPGPVPPPDPSAPAGQCDFTFDRSGYRVPAIIVSPWIDEGTVINDEYRHTSLLATLRKSWDLGDPFSDRDAAARTFDHLLSRETPARPRELARRAPAARAGMAAHQGAARSGAQPARQGHRPGAESTPSRADSRSPPTSPTPRSPRPGKQLVEVVFDIAAHYFPRLAEAAESSEAQARCFLTRSTRMIDERQVAPRTTPLLTTSLQE